MDFCDAIASARRLGHVPIVQPPLPRERILSIYRVEHDPAPDLEQRNEIARRRWAARFVSVVPELDRIARLYAGTYERARWLDRWTSRDRLRRALPAVLEETQRALERRATNVTSIRRRRRA